MLLTRGLYRSRNSRSSSNRGESQAALPVGPGLGSGRQSSTKSGNGCPEDLLLASMTLSVVRMRRLFRVPAGGAEDGAGAFNPGVRGVLVVLVRVEAFAAVPRYQRTGGGADSAAGRAGNFPAAGASIRMRIPALARESESACGAFE